MILDITKIKIYLNTLDSRGPAEKYAEREAEGRIDDLGINSFFVRPRAVS
jgi:hypothetical protein